ncbi:hypothetical protein [Pelagibacterium lacus]|uniref:Uncharacterized protein n=1 Tax=Pelagibacterium lacus TaxID=2282655 RepID=A0A369W183_9HYPH|nr:hypothetical protein [Pelagibacterium lacus]RDE07799.1 hypothetical protein DVH29_14820 [Pelagibacterium lacus]
MSIEITVPGVDVIVQYHHEDAEHEIARMSPSRSYGADTNLSTWRRALTAVKLNGTDGYAFEGHSLKPEDSATLNAGTVVIAVDTSWARASWYAGSYVKPVERSARLLLVKEDGLETLIESSKKSWARDLLGYLATNRQLCEEAGIEIIGG